MERALLVCKVTKFFRSSLGNVFAPAQGLWLTFGIVLSPDILAAGTVRLIYALYTTYALKHSHFVWYNVQHRSTCNAMQCMNQIIQGGNNRTVLHLTMWFVGSSTSQLGVLRFAQMGNSTVMCTLFDAHDNPTRLAQASPHDHGTGASCIYIWAFSNAIYNAYCIITILLSTNRKQNFLHRIFMILMIFALTDAHLIRFIMNIETLLLLYHHATPRYSNYYGQHWFIIDKISYIGAFHAFPAHIIYSIIQLILDVYILH